MSVATPSRTESVVINVVCSYFDYIGYIKIRIVIIHYRSIGEDDAVLFCNSMLSVNVAEQMCFRVNIHYMFKKRF